MKFRKNREKSTKWSVARVGKIAFKFEISIISFLWFTLYFVEYPQPKVPALRSYTYTSNKETKCRENRSHVVREKPKKQYWKFDTFFDFDFFIFAFYTLHKNNRTTKYELLLNISYLNMVHQEEAQPSKISSSNKFSW